MSYSIPPIGTVLPARENVNPTIPNPGTTSDPVQFNEWSQAAAQDQAFHRNMDAANYYQTDSFPSWLTQTYPFQPNPDLAPPTPPAALVVLAAPAEAAPVDFQIVPSGSTVTMPFTPEDGTGPDYTTGPLIPVCDPGVVPDAAKLKGPDQAAAEKHGHHKKR